MKEMYSELQKFKVVLKQRKQQNALEMIEQCSSISFNDNTLHIEAPLEVRDKLKAEDGSWNGDYYNFHGYVYQTERDNLLDAAKLVSEREIREIEVSVNWGATIKGPVETPILEAVKDSTKNIDDLIKKCNERLFKGDYDGAITIARTLVETVCLHILNEEESDGDLIKIYKRAAKQLNIEHLQTRI